MLEAANLVRLLPPVEEHVPSDIFPSWLWDEPDRLYASSPQVEIDEDRLGDPGSEKLNESSNSRVPGECVGELEQPNGAVIGASIMVQCYGCVSRELVVMSEETSTGEATHRRLWRS